MSANDTAGNNFNTSSLSVADLKRAVAQVSAVFSDPSQLNIAIRENLSDGSSVLRDDLTLDDLTLVLELDSIDLIIIITVRGNRGKIAPVHFPNRFI